MRALEIPIGNSKSKSSINRNINCNISIKINCIRMDIDACVTSDQDFEDDDGNDWIGLLISDTTNFLELYYYKVVVVYFHNSFFPRKWIS